LRARPKSEKKSDPAAPAERRILPMQLQVGDRLADETGEWEVIGLPYSAAGGKIVQVRVQRAGHDRPGFRTYGAHERVSVKRATAEEGKR
jgi:hypothetical protein